MPNTQVSRFRHRTVACVAAYSIGLAFVQASTVTKPLWRRQTSLLPSSSSSATPATAPAAEEEEEEEDDDEDELEIPMSGFIGIVFGCIFGGFLLCGWVIFLWNRWRAHSARKKMEEMRLKLLEQDRAAAKIRDFDADTGSQSSANTHPGRSYSVSHSVSHSLTPSNSISQVPGRAPTYVSVSGTPPPMPGPYMMHPRYAQSVTKELPDFNQPVMVHEIPAGGPPYYSSSDYAAGHPPGAFWPAELPVPTPGPVDGFNYHPASVVGSIRDGALQRGEPVYRYGPYVYSPAPYSYRPSAGDSSTRVPSMRSHVEGDGQSSAAGSSEGVSPVEVSPVEGSVVGTSFTPESVTAATVTTQATDDSGTLDGMESVKRPPILAGGRLQQYNKSA